MMLKFLIGAFFLGTFSACSRPLAFTDHAMVRFDDDTMYRVEESLSGFTVFVEHSRYQLLPEGNTVMQETKQALMAIAYRHADELGKKIVINEQRIQLSMGRNGLSGMSTCTATAPVEFK